MTILFSSLDRFVQKKLFSHATQTSKLVSNVQGQFGLRVVIIVDNDRCGNDGWLPNHKLRLFCVFLLLLLQSRGFFCSGVSKQPINRYDDNYLFLTQTNIWKLLMMTSLVVAILTSFLHD